MAEIVISGTGLFTPPHVVTNEELVGAYNSWAEKFNKENAKAIARGELEEAQFSNVDFIEKASGIKRRYVMYKEGILDVDRMLPVVPRRSPEELSICAEMAVSAAMDALAVAHKEPQDIDLVICGASTTQRAWPAVAVEIQKELGCSGYAYDMSVACATATFAMSNAMDALLSGTATCVLVVNPEYISPQLNYRDRDSHFIFGDVATAFVLEKKETATATSLFKIVDRKMKTEFSNNIRSDFSYVTRSEPDLTLERLFEQDQFFVQQGRKVFKELLPLVVNLVKKQAQDCELDLSEVRRMWLHQANINMNHFAAQKLAGRAVSQEEAPIILDEFANTASAGSIIAFHRYHEDFASGDYGVICAFGAGYSVGSVIVQKV